jgi:hypothetical protein
MVNQGYFIQDFITPIFTSESNQNSEGEKAIEL